MVKIKELKTLSEFIDQAKQLRINAEEAEARFLLFLCEFELLREDLWKTAGIATYDGFLQSSQLCNSARYRNFVAGTKIVLESAEDIGASATIAAARFRMPTEESVREYISRCGKFRDVHHVTPSEQTSREWVKQLDQSEPRVVRQASRMRQLEAELLELRAEKRAMDRKLREAQNEINRLRQELDSKKVA